MIVLALGAALVLTEAAKPKPMMADCDAAPRSEPSLDAKRLPSARFKVANEVVGSENRNGRSVDLVYPVLTETATLKSGTKVRIELGGCETAGTTYEFELGPDNHSLADGRYWFEKADTLVAEVEAVSRPDPYLFKMLHRALKADARAYPRHDFSKSEYAQDTSFPNDGHVVGVKRRNGVTHVSVGYYQPL